MGHKTHPIGFRLGIIKDWQGRWFAGKGKDYRRILNEDIRIRKALNERYTDAGIARVRVQVVLADRALDEFVDKSIDSIGLRSDITVKRRRY